MKHGTIKGYLFTTLFVGCLLVIAIARWREILGWLIIAGLTALGIGSLVVLSALTGGSKKGERWDRE